MTGKRKRYSAAKAKVALEAPRSELTTAQLAAKHGVHQTMVGEWKKQAMGGWASVFSEWSALLLQSPSPQLVRGNIQSPTHAAHAFPPHPPGPRPQP